MDSVIPWGDASFEDVGDAGSSAGSDEALIRQIARGDRAAMDRFYRRNAERIYRFALSRTGDPVAAEDVVSGTMLKVWTDAGRFRAQSRGSTWWLGIAYHLAIDHMRAPADGSAR